ncbi:hypothetical protein PTKU46_96510 [Paraburkholderia terrae]
MLRDWFADYGTTEFAAWWSAHDIRSAVYGQKVLIHPARGALR